LDDRERAYWVAFNRVPGIGVARFRLLLERFGSLAAAWQAPPRDLAQAGLDRRALDALLAARPQLRPERELERVGRLRAKVVTWHDAAYPPLLAAIPDPPPVLYVRGRLAADQALAIVGTRRATLYGRDAAERLAADLASAGLTIVSGLAKGIDTHAHRGALKAGGHTIAVLGHGIDTCYPPENRRLAAEIAERGALVTDYAVGTSPLGENFPPRNRIISGLAAGVLVVEAGETSGALITSRYAAEQGRDVFAVPGPITAHASRGCHRLIQDGAKLVRTWEDVVAEWPAAWRRALRPVTTATPAAEGPRGVTESRLLPLLGDEPIAIDRVIAETGLPAGEVAASLMALELRGLVKQLAGQRYIKV
jgi:DNA processing protein